MSQDRYIELRSMLEKCRREVASEIKRKLRDVRNEHDYRRAKELVHDADADVQEEIELTLIQTNSETLNKINEALRRLDEGTYGNCDNCGEEIAEARLRALPFAVRCKGCEEKREAAEQRERSHQRAFGNLFVDHGPGFDSR